MSSSLLEIQELCKSHDVILLQETWLAKQQLHSLSSIHDDFLFVGTSCMDLEDGVMTTRPHVGTAVLWRKSLTAYPVSNVDKSIVGINIKCQNNSIVIINVYLPFNSPSNVRRRRLKGVSTPVRHKQDWGRGFILLLPQTAALPGSDAGSDVIKPASSFVIQNRQTACSMWCPMYGAHC